MSQFSTRILSRMPALTQPAGRAAGRLSGTVRRAAVASSQRLGQTARSAHLTRPSTRTVVVTGAVVAGAAIATPLLRIAYRSAAQHLAARRQRTAGHVRGLDLLTSLPNRAEAEWWLVRRLELARSRRQRLAVLVMDLDDFASVNEAYGRVAGDHVLQVTAARLQALLRTGDMVCRTGNDTFMVIMDLDGPDHLVARISERVVESVAQAITFGDDEIMVRASVGFAISQDREADPQLLLGRADRAVIQAKASQRPIVQF
jgi:diguanylate cyclase (GGDEF)-like protein